MTNNSVTVSDILKHRALRKRLGMVGCKDGRDMPLSSLRGISWRPSDPKNPSCFCTDCRDTWDADGVIDAELVNEGHKRACWTYEALLSKAWEQNSHPAPQRTMTEHPEAYARGVPREVFFPPMRRITPELITPPRRDVVNEMDDQRLKNDLLELMERVGSENAEKVQAVLRLLHE